MAWDNDRLASIVRTQIALGNALRKSQQLEAKSELLRGKMPNIISDSPRMSSASIRRLNKAP